MTADAMEEARTSCEEAGMDDYITKPVDKVALRNLLTRWVIFDEEE